MQLLRAFKYFLVVAVISSCTAMELPDLVEEPVPDGEFLVQRNFDTKCPSFYGVFSRVPNIAHLIEGENWQFELGQDFSYALLLPLQDATVEEFEPEQADTVLKRDQILIDSRLSGELVRVALYNRKENRFESYVLRVNQGDYLCNKGSLEFPEFVVSGGGEGFTLNARTYRRASVSTKGDFYFYEQVSGFKQTHKFFRFTRIR